MNGEKNKPICIIGMHRSGTSMVTRLLSLCGLDLGPAEELLGPEESNPLGHFENRGFHKINEALLKRLGGSWDNPPQFKKDWEYDSSLEPIVCEARSLLRTFSKTSLWGWKDPRTTVLLPFWKSLIPDLRFVICVRSPLEVANSLARRDRMPIQKGVYLWNQYMRAAIRDTENHSRIFTFYEDFFDEASAEIDRLAMFCGLTKPDDPSQVQQAISPKLRNHASETAELLGEAGAITEYKLFYIGLRALSIQARAQSMEPDKREISISKNIGRFLHLLEQFHDENETARLQAALAEKEQQTIQFSARLSQSDAALADTQRLATERAGEVERLTERLDRTDAALAETQRLAIERAEETKRLTEQLQKTEVALTDARRLALEQAQEIGRASGALDAAVRRIAILEESHATTLAELGQSRAEAAHWRREYEILENTLFRRLTKSVREFAVRFGNGVVGVCDLLVRYGPLFGGRWRRMEIVPANDLERETATGVWRSTGNDPQFALRPTGRKGALPAGWWSIDLEMQYQNNAWPPHLYWDGGEGFHERNCHILPLPKGGRITATVPFPVRVKTLRLDPLESEGTFSFRNARLRHVSRYGAALSAVLPHAGRALRNPRAYFAVPGKVFLLWNTCGIRGIKGALRQLVLTGSGVSVRNYINAQVAVKRSLALNRRMSARLLSAGQKSNQEVYRIGIGLVEHFGDIVACEPVVRYIKAKYPNAEISWVVNQAYRELIDSHPNIDKTIAVDCLTDWIKWQAHGAFDQVVDLHVNKRICQHCNIALLKKSGNPAISGGNYFNHGSLLEAFSLGAGLPPLTDSPRVYISEAVVKAVDALALPEPFIVVHCRSNERAKDWKYSKWHELATRIISQCNISIVEIGSQPTLNEKTPKIINLCGKTSLLETAEVIRRACLFAGVDSGPAHLANAVGTYGVVLLGRVGPFKKYNPFTGGFGDETNATLIRNGEEPAASITLEQVEEAIVARLIPAKLETHAGATITQESARSLLAFGDRNNTSPETRTLGGKREAARVIAFYLPQYHPIPENDKAWGKGFTEWRNVGKATPFFKGQYQPRLPGELGYYDLRVPEVMDQQAALAKEYGIFGFCYYYYWFQGKRLLHVPIDNLLRRKRPDFPFCFCWANENWTRCWDGSNSEIIIAQKHTHKDDIDFIRHLIPAFDDPRYIRVNGKPLLLVYRTELFPNPLRTAELWRAEAQKAGIGDLFLVRCEGFDARTKPEEIGFDASYEVPGLYPAGRTPLRRCEELECVAGIQRPNFRLRKNRWILFAAAGGAL